MYEDRRLAWGPNIDGSGIEPPDLSVDFTEAVR
jgi:hypothetical protein